MTAETQRIQFIPLNQVVPSPRNVRRKDRKAEIDALAASIAARGLLQNLCVVPSAEGKFEVDAGGRRLAALKKLARDKTIPKDFAVPCHVVALEEGREVSLIENVHRVAMDAMDEVDAFAALIADGAPTVRHADYLGSWLQVLKGDNRAIFQAASMASKAADFVMGRRDAGKGIEPGGS